MKVMANMNIYSKYLKQETWSGVGKIDMLENKTFLLYLCYSCIKYVCLPDLAHFGLDDCQDFGSFVIFLLGAS